MTAENKYAPLRRAAVLMALDTAALVADAVILLLTSILASEGKPSFLTSGVNIYLSWTLWGTRLLISMLTLALLSSMMDLHRAFGKARLWYFLRILSFAGEIVSMGGVMYLYYAATPELARFAVLAIFLDLGLTLLAETLLLCMGNRAILLAGAALLESFGLDEAAKRSRRCGKLLFGFAAAYAVFWVSAYTIFLTGSAHFPDGFPEWLSLLDVAAFLLCIPAWLGIGVLVIRAPLCMNRAYLAIKELCE